MNSIVSPSTTAEVYILIGTAAAAQENIRSEWFAHGEC